MIIMEKQYHKNIIFFRLIGDQEMFVNTLSQEPMDGLSPNLHIPVGVIRGSHDLIIF
jgi:hypothetical protein